MKPPRLLITTTLLLATCRSQPAQPPRQVSASPDVHGIPSSARTRWHHPSTGLSWANTEVPFDDALNLLGSPVTDRILVWTVVRLDLTRASPRVERAPNASLEDFSHVTQVRFAVDGGFFNSDHSPSGLLVTDGTQLAALTQGGGSGVLRIHHGHAEVLARDEPPDGSFGAQLAVQCGPRLVERGGLVGIHRDDSRRFARTAACVRDHGRTLDIVLTWDKDLTLVGPGLLRFAQRLASPSPLGDPQGCEVALNLDGGPSTGGFVRETPAGQGFFHPALGPTPWLLTVRE